MKAHKNIEVDSLQILCDSVRTLCDEEDFEKSVQLICIAMGQFPHSPIPHNLYGIVLEKQGDHPLAMKHFRASWALDPTYEPASYNLHNYGTFYSSGKCAFDEKDTTLFKKKKTYPTV